jgi:hypothetical protein
VFKGNISLDPCSNVYSVVNADKEYILPHQDGLKENWKYAKIFVNPPYGKDYVHNTRIADWLKKCQDAHANYTSEVIALIPVATNTGHWKKYIFGKADVICFLADTRLKFLVNGKDMGTGAPMSCAMIYWGKNIKKFMNIFYEFGAVVDITNLKNIRK